MVKAGRVFPIDNRIPVQAINGSALWRFFERAPTLWTTGRGGAVKHETVTAVARLNAAAGCDFVRPNPYLLGRSPRRHAPSGRSVYKQDAKFCLSINSAQILAVIANRFRGAIRTQT
jgi:hypothetical protein